MGDKKPTKTFILCDKNGTKYEVNEYTIIAEMSGKNATITESTKLHTVTKNYVTSDGKYVKLKNNKFILEESKIELYSCDS
jgi:hypothetical protein